MYSCNNNNNNNIVFIAYYCFSNREDRNVYIHSAKAAKNILIRKCVWLSLIECLCNNYVFPNTREIEFGLIPIYSIYTIIYIYTTRYCRNVNNTHAYTSSGRVPIAKYYRNRIFQYRNSKKRSCSTRYVFPRGASQSYGTHTHTHTPHALANTVRVLVRDNV